MGVRLPAEYQEVEYLESTGTQVINTGLYMDQDSAIELKTVINKIGDSRYYGAAQAYNIRSFECYYYNGNLEFNFVSVKNISLDSVPNGSIGIITCDNTNATLSYDGEVLTKSISGSSIFETPTTLCLFALNRPNGYDFGKVKIYYAIIKKSNVLVRNLVPCYRKSDDEPGMYDLVSKTFYTNQGTGEFLVGPDVVNRISPRLMDRRRVLIAKLTSLFKNIISSETGIASFNTNFAKPMKVTCEFSPKQDLHGYDNPWPAGGGKNLLNEVAYSSLSSVEYSNGVFSGGQATPWSTYNNCYFVRVKNGDTIVVWGRLSYDQSTGRYGRSINVDVTAIDTLIIGVLGTNYNNEVSFASSDVFPESGTYYVSYKVNTPVPDGGGNFAFSELQVSKSSEYSYAPYENICPISGWSSSTIMDQGENLIDQSSINVVNGYYRNDNGVETQTANSFYISNTYPVQPSGFYHLENEEQYFRSVRIYYLTESEQWIQRSATYLGTSINFGVPSDCYKIQLQFNVQDTITNLSLRKQDSIYIPFNNPGTYDFLPIQEGTGDPSPENVRPITPGLILTRDDNTTLEVWGGSLTVNADGTGSLVSKYISHTLRDIYVVKSSGTTEPWIYRYAVKWWRTGQSWEQSTDFMSDILRPGNATSNGELSTYNGYIYDDVATDADEVKEKYADAQIVYRMAEVFHETYTLSIAETSRAFEALGLGKNLGPLYGGSVTLNEDGSCDVVVDRAFAQKTLSQGVQTIGDDFDQYRFDGFFTVAPVGIPNSKIGKISNIGTYSYNNAITHKFPHFYVLGTGLVYVYVPHGTSTDTVFQAVSPIATPQTYHFSSIADFKSFIGTNNVWSDLNGPITVEYYNNKKE